MTDLPLLQQAKRNPRRGQADEDSIIIGTMLLFDSSSAWAAFRLFALLKMKRKVAGFEDLTQHLKGAPSQCSLDSSVLKAH